MLIMKNLGAILPLLLIPGTGTTAAVTCPSWQIAWKATAAQAAKRILEADLELFGSRREGPTGWHRGRVSGVHQGDTAGTDASSYTRLTSVIPEGRVELPERCFMM